MLVEQIFRLFRSFFSHLALQNCFIYSSMRGWNEMFTSLPRRFWMQKNGSNANQRADHPRMHFRATIMLNLPFNFLFSSITFPVPNTQYFNNSLKFNSDASTLPFAYLAMVSRDLTCKETMPPLDDGDHVMDMRRVRNVFTAQQPVLNTNGNSAFSRFGSVTANSGPSATAPSNAQQQMNHTTTVRDVVTRHIRNNKLNAEAHLAGYPKLGGILSSIGHLGALNSSSRQQDTLLLVDRHPINVQGNNGCLLTTGGHRFDDGGGDEQRRYTLISPSSTCSSSSIPPTTSTTLKSPNNNHTHFIASPPQHQITTRHVITSASALDGGTTYLIRAGNAMDAFVAPPLFEQQQHVQHNHVHATTANSTTTTKTHWALHPPLGEHGSTNNASPSSATSTNVQRGSQSPQKNCRTTTTTPVSPYKTSAPANDHHHRTYSSVLPAPTSFHPPNATPRTPPMHRQQQSPQHTSPRPTILRGNGTIRRLMDRDRPASVCGHGAESYGNGMKGNCLEKGESMTMFGGDESPRKRQRKQHFDSSQLVPDKLRMEVIPDQRLKHTASAGPSLTDWQSGSSNTMSEMPVNSTSMNSQQEMAIHQADHSTTVGSMLLSDGKIIGGGKAIPGKRSGENAQPKKRGRPKMNCRTQQLPIASVATTDGGEQQRMMNDNNHQLGGGRITNNSEETMFPKPMMVDVDSILQTDAKNVKKRKYRKRIPQMDPLTGELMVKMKKVQNKGCGRKSKKDVERFVGDSVAFPRPNCIARNHSSENAFLNASSPTYNRMPTMMDVETAEERDVISMLCQFKSDQDSNRAKAEAAASSVSTSSESKPLGCKSAAKKLSKQQQQNSERACSDQPSSSHGLATKAPLLPLLADLKDLDALRPLLRRSERGLNSTDNCHLGESYDEIVNFLDSNLNCAVGQSDPAYRLLKNKQAFVPNRQLDEHLVDKLSAEVTCSVFDNYEEFRNSTNTLRLLPLACAYFDASQRLLNSLRTSLLGVSLYQTLQSKILQKEQREESNPTESLGHNLVPLAELKTPTVGKEQEGSEEEREERLIRAFFKRLISEFTDNQLCGDQNSHDGQNENSSLQQKAQQLEQKFLLQLDVAQTLDSLLDCVERNKIHRSTTTTTASNDDEQQPCSSRSQTVTLNTESVKNDLGPIRTDVHRVMATLPDNLRHILLTKRPTKRKMTMEKQEERQKERKRGKKDRKKRRRRDEEERKGKKEEEEEEWEEEEKKPNKEVAEQRQEISHSEQLLRDISRLREQSVAESTLLDVASRILFKLERMANSRRATPESTQPVADPPKCEKGANERRKRNPHKSRQFAFRPSTQLIDKLFKDIPTLKLQSAEQDIVGNKKAPIREQRRPEASSSNNSGTEQHQRKEREDNHNTNGTPHLLRADLEEMAEHCGHIAEKALAQLLCKYPDIGMGEGTDPSPSSSVSKYNNSFFVPSLRFHFPSISSTSQEQTEFLRDRFRELREICGTAAGLLRARATLTGQCVDSVREFLSKEMDEGSETKMMVTKKNDPEETNRRKKAIVARSKSGTKQERKMSNLEEEDQEAEEVGGARQQYHPENNGPLKREAHRKALSQLMSSSSRSVSVSSRGASRAQSVEETKGQQPPR